MVFNIIPQAFHICFSVQGSDLNTLLLRRRREREQAPSSGIRPKGTQVKRVKAKGPVSSHLASQWGLALLGAGPRFVMLPQGEYRVRAKQSPLSEGGSGFPRPLL